MDVVRSNYWTAVISGLFIADDLRRRRFTLNPLADPILWDDLLLVEPERNPLGVHLFDRQKAVEPPAAGNFALALSVNSG